MSFTITRKVAKEKLAKILPRAYSEFGSSVQLIEPVTVVVFDDSVVKSGTLRKALHKVGEVDGQSVLLVGREFTQEALHIANERGAVLMTETCQGWTDDSHEEIRILIGAKMKKPDWR